MDDVSILIDAQSVSQRRKRESVLNVKFPFKEMLHN